MKKIIATLLVILLSVPSFSQGSNGGYSQQVHQFLEWKFKGIKPVVFAESLDSVTFENIKTILAKDTFYGRIDYHIGDANIIDTLCFTKEDRQQIDSVLHNRKNAILNDTLSGNAITVYSKTSNPYNSQFSYQVSNPIFIRNNTRNNTLCIFYCASISM